MREPTAAVAPVSAMTRGSRSLARRRRRGGVGRGGVGGPAHHLLGGRVDDVVGPAGGLDPLAADEEAVFVGMVGHLGHLTARTGPAPGRPGPCPSSLARPALTGPGGGGRSPRTRRSGRTARPPSGT